VLGMEINYLMQSLTCEDRGLTGVSLRFWVVKTFILSALELHFTVLDVFCRLGNGVLPI